MGLLIQDNDGSPAYALFTEENKVDKSNQIYNDLKEELKILLKKDYLEVILMNLQIN